MRHVGESGALESAGGQCAGRWRRYAASGAGLTTAVAVVLPIATLVPAGALGIAVGAADPVTVNSTVALGPVIPNCATILPGQARLAASAGHRLGRRSGLDIPDICRIS